MPVKYIPYDPDPVEGQALLDTITRNRRVLRYRENNEVFYRIERGMPYFELDELETVGPKSDAESGNLLIRGECVSACAYLKAQNIKVDLVYIDPPFASGADYAKKVYLRRNPHRAAELDAAERELDIEELRAFEETMYGDIWRKEDYLNWMYENLTAIKTVMSETASIYVHLDWHIGHYVKILMDEIFGEDNFLNEIVWHYSGWNKKLNASFEKRNDSIFFYCKGERDDTIFNSYFEEYSSKEEYVKKRKQKVFVDEETGREYVLSDAGGGKRVKRFIEEALTEGYVADNVWNLDKINNSATESLEYNTQKPEALLERIIKASSNEGMVVADFFGGSGVTAKVANDLGRRFVHCDIGLNSIQTARDRLKEAEASFTVLEVKDGVSLFRNPQQTMTKLVQLIPSLQQDKKQTGLSKFWFGAVQDSKLGTVPVFVPNLLDSREKVLDVPALNRVINEALPELEPGVQKVIVYYIDLEDPAELKKFIGDNNATEITVELKDLKNVLQHVVAEDIIDYECQQTGAGYTLGITSIISDRLNGKLAEFNEKGNLQALKKGQAFTPIEVSEAGLELIELVALDCENGSGPWHSSRELKLDKKGYVTLDGVKTKGLWDGTISAETKPLRLKVRNISGDETILPVKCWA